MNNEVRTLLNQVESVPDFFGTKLSDINDTNGFGDNALHCVCVWGELESAKLLVENGINLEQKGEGGYTPLKVASMYGHKDIVDYLLESGADKTSLKTEFVYDSEASSKHIQKLEKGVVELENEISSKCNK
jgi:ankyrin repeat protein